MERSEPSLAPQWLRNNGGGTGSGNSCHHIASSDDTLLALQKQNRTSRSLSNTNGPYSSFPDRKTSTNPRRSLSNNGSSKHDKHYHARSYSGYSRNQHRDRERLDADTWDSEYSDSFTSLVVERFQNGCLRRSQSMNLSRPRELSQPKIFTDLRNKNHKINANGNVNGVVIVASDSADIQKVPSEKNFPLLRSDERPPTPDTARVSSPRLSRSAHGLSIGTSALISSEGQTSALAEVRIGAGNSSIVSLPAMEPPPYAVAVATPPVSPSMSNAAGASNRLNLAGALELGPSRSQNAPQSQTQRFEELTFMGSKRLIAMTPSMPKTSVLNPSDMLKPKAAMKSNEAVPGFSNGLQQTSSLQLGSQPVRGGGTKADGLKSCPTGKLLLLKSARENSQTINIQSAIANGQSACGSSVASMPSKISQNMKLVDKKCSLAQQSRNDFFNLMRKKSMSSTSVAADSGTVVSCNGQISDELKEIANGPLTPTESGGQVKCNGDECNLAQSSYYRESDLSNDAAIYPNAEEEAFLRSLGWEDSAGDEDGLTEEEINSFVQKLKIMTQSDHMKWKSASKLWQGLQLKILAQSDSQACSAGVSSELSS